MPSLGMRAASRITLRRPLHQIPKSLTVPRITKRHRNDASQHQPPPPPPMPRRAHCHAATTSGTSIPAPSTVGALPLWQRLGPLTQVIQAYARAQRNRPYTTQFCASLVIYFLGDLGAQSLDDEDYDPGRTGRALLISAGSSIVSYKWFLFLGTSFNFPSRLLSLCTKVIINQLLFTPIFNTYFFGMQSLLANFPHLDLAATWTHITRTVPRSFFNSWKLWPAVTAFSFTFVAPQHRSLFAGTIAIGWQTYLSYLNLQAEHGEAGERDDLVQVRAAS